MLLSLSLSLPRPRTTCRFVLWAFDWPQDESAAGFREGRDVEGGGGGVVASEKFEATGWDGMGWDAVGASGGMVYMMS